MSKVKPSYERIAYVFYCQTEGQRKGQTENANLGLTWKLMSSDIKRQYYQQAKQDFARHCRQRLVEIGRV